MRLQNCYIKDIFRISPTSLSLYWSMYPQILNCRKSSYWYNKSSLSKDMVQYWHNTALYFHSIIQCQKGHKLDHLNLKPDLNYVTVVYRCSNLVYRIGRQIRATYKNWGNRLNSYRSDTLIMYINRVSVFCIVCIAWHMNYHPVNVPQSLVSWDTYTLYQILFYCFF